jgi:hypothetical protein
VFHPSAASALTWLTSPQVRTGGTIVPHRRTGNLWLTDDYALFAGKRWRDIDD